MKRRAHNPPSKRIGVELSLSNEQTQTTDKARIRKLLVIGASGMLGSKLVLIALKRGYEVFGTHNQGKPVYPASVSLDIADRSATMSLVDEVRPDVIVNTAALHNVEYCESHQEEARTVNVVGTANLADAAIKQGSRLVYVSTDYVFDGETGHYSESDAPNPINFYGRTKLEGEQVTSKVPSHAIARSSVIYGWNPSEIAGVPSGSGKTVSFAMYVLAKLGRGEIVNAVNDRFCSPTFVDNLAESLLRIADYDGSGFFHTAGRSCLSRCEFALKIAETFGYPKSLVRPVSSAEFDTIAGRPKNSCLSVEDTEKELGMRFLTVDEGLQEMKSQFLVTTGRNA